MINEEILLNNGYHEYKDNFSLSDKSFQKKITSERGIAYFINIHEYMINDRTDYEVNLQFEKERYTLNITMFCLDKMTIEEIEKEVHDIWYRLGCKYYEVNDE